MQAKLFFYSLTIKEMYLDAFGHVNNAAYLTILEEARWDLLNKNGYDMAKVKESGLAPTILQINLIFLKELRLNDEILIETQLLSYDKKIGKLAQRIIRNGEVCCTAEFVIGLFSLKERKLVLPTPDWSRAIGLA